MTDEEGDCIYETRESTIHKWRVFYWAVGIIFPLALSAVAVWQGAVLVLAIVVFVAAWGFHLLNGFRTVIGVRVYSDRLGIITPLANREFPWRRVTIRKYPAIFFGADIYVDSEVWPFMMGFPDWTVLDAMEKARSSSSGLPD